MPESALCRKRTPVRVNLGIRTLPMETRILPATACTFGYPYSRLRLPVYPHKKGGSGISGTSFFRFSLAF